MMTDDQIIAVVQAHKEGKKIQMRLQPLPMDGPSMEWIDTIHPCWDFDHYDYRVAPEQRKPRDFWLVSFDEFGDYHVFDNPRKLGHKQIHVREVIEEDKKSTIQRMMEYATGFKE